MGSFRGIVLLGISLVSAAHGMRCPNAALDSARFRSVAAASAELTALRNVLPGIDGPRLVALAESIEGAVPLRKAERLSLVLLHLALDERRPRNGEEAFRLIVDTMKAVEKSYLPDDVVALWARETNRPVTRDELVEAAFLAYEFDDPESDYDRQPHPQAFSGVLKPPARRYTRRNVFAGLDVITQLDHITIINQRNGAVEIQRIEPSLGSHPLVVAILNDPAYFLSLPERSSLVLLQRPGGDGRGVWR